MKIASVLAVALLAMPVTMAAQTAQAQTARPAPPTSRELVQPPRFGLIAISPNGRYLALVRRQGLIDTLSVIDTVGRTQKTVFNATDAAALDIEQVVWKGDDRVVIFWRAYTVRTDAGGEAKTRRIDGETYEIIDRWGVGISSIDRVSGAITDLGKGFLSDPLDVDPGRVLVGQYDGAGRVRGDHYMRRASLYSVDVATAQRTQVETGIVGTMDWDVDASGKPAIRYDVYGRRGGLRVMGRDARGEWSETFAIRPKDFEAVADIAILGPTSDPGKFYVGVKSNETTGARTRELRIYDFITRTMGEKLWSHPLYDFDDIVVDGPRRRLAAVCYWAETYVCDYLDKTEDRETKALSGFFDGDRSVSVVGSSSDGQLRLLSVTGADEPGSYYLYDRKTQKVNLLGSGHPALRPDRLAVVRPHRWKASDGKELGGYLTSPAPSASGKPPLIVMPHGGPEARDRFGFDPWAQAFATRGYVVFQPNFRGSAGFGAAFAEEGYGQWGLRMQDDVIDGVKDLIARGLVDPDRICILGASYGGYVALQAGAKHPDLFKCVVSQAGVSDLTAMIKWERNTFDEDSPRYKYWLKSIGDPARDGDRLKAASPVTYAAAYGPPVLLLHGEDDWIVPIEQSKIMERALKAAGRKVELVTYNDAGHSGWDTDDRIDGLDRMLEFVDKAIGRKP